MANVNPKSLTPKQQKALAALLSCANLTDAAKASNLGQRTLFRYLRTPHFAEAYQTARHELVQNSIAQLQKLSATAVTALEKVFTEGYAKPSVQVRAAEVVLNLSLRSIEIESIESRLAALEQAAQETA